MWIDTNGCESGYHIIGKNEEGKWQVTHSDDSLCEETEFGGEMFGGIEYGD